MGLSDGERITKIYFSISGLLKCVAEAAQVEIGVSERKILGQYRYFYVSLGRHVLHRDGSWKRPRKDEDSTVREIKKSAFRTAQEAVDALQEVVVPYEPAAAEVWKGIKT